MGSMDTFVRERNVEMYLDRLYTELDDSTRHTLFRLLVDEESKMAKSREHLENGERRVADGLARLEKQRQLVAALTTEGRARAVAASLLEALETIQALLEAHCRRLRCEFENNKF